MLILVPYMVYQYWYRTRFGFIVFRQSENNHSQHERDRIALMGSHYHDRGLNYAFKPFGMDIRYSIPVYY